MVLLPAGLTAAELPPNQWVRVNESGGGVRRGSATAWLAREKRFLVVGGVTANKDKKIAQPFEVQTFDPAARAWAEVRPDGLDLASFKKTDSRDLLWRNAQGQYRLNPRMALGQSAVYDPKGRRLYVFQTTRPGKFIVACYGVDARTWRVLSEAKPPAKADGEYRGEWGMLSVFMEGVSAALDPIHNELLLIGGRTANADDGFVGHWALSLADKQWRRLTADCGVLDPLRAKCLAAKGPTRDAMAAARNVYYAGLEPAKQAAAVKDRPVRLVGQALALARAAADALGSAKAAGWKGQAVAHAKARVSRAVVGLGTAREGFAAGKLDAELIRKVFDATWAIDEAADLLRALPGARMYAGAGYDPQARAVVVFGGDHGDYLMSDTWVYDCASKTWRRAFPARSPQPRRAAGRILWLGGSRRLALAGGATYVPKFMYFRRRPQWLSDVWTFDVKAGQWSMLFSGRFKKGAPAPALVCQLAAGDDDVILGLSSAGRWPQQWDGTTWLMRVGDQVDSGAEKQGVPLGKRTYLSVVPQYDPCWYDAAPKPDAKATAAWLAKLKPNTWTAVPLAPRPAPKRSWGTAAFDPDRDQFYHWTGGHQADPTTIVSTYHPGIGRWSIPYVAEYAGKGFTFNGRPDCRNHTYLNYTYDVVSRKLVCTARGGTGVYDPDRREFETRIPQPFFQHSYYTKTVATPRGVVCWTRGWLGLLDLAERKWKKLPVKGKFPRSVHGDENSITYDPKRDCLWLMAADGYQKMNGQVWRYDLKTAEVRAMEPPRAKAIGAKVRPREAVYLPKLDLVLHNGFANNRQAAYDPRKNRWVTLSIEKRYKTLGGVEIGLMVDLKRDLVWAMDGGQRMFVLRIDTDSLEITGGR